MLCLTVIFLNMLTPIDKFLYSDNCVVVRIDAEYIFPIYKNGSTSLFRHCYNGNGTIFDCSTLNSINDNITVIIRNPAERFKAGIATVIYNLKKQHPELDTNTIEFLLKKYRYLDVHYVPQFHWLLNLSRFVDSTTKLNLKPMSYLSQVTNLREIPLKVDELSIEDDLLQDLYLQLDTILYNQIGNTLTFKELISIIKNDNDSGYNDITRIPFSIIELIK